ncbi:MAG: 50S ribosomal protein L24 [Verrucomicrobia bacterium]|nr:MAG: 50S ribosomal protein L24 [Verrucomicrobiota bacterium]PYJ96823.1 MAG: 50S ribosomal protein L24 [Verrucomicrobiota bacterium]
MRRFHVRKGDEVVVIAGTERGKRGKVITILSGKQRLIVEGVKMIKKHQRKSQQHPQGAIIEREGSIHLSNVMLAERFDARAAKRGAVSADA